MLNPQEVRAQYAAYIAEQQAELPNKIRREIESGLIHSFSTGRILIVMENVETVVEPILEEYRAKGWEMEFNNTGFMPYIYFWPNAIQEKKENNND